MKPKLCIKNSVQANNKEIIQISGEYILPLL